MKFSLFLLAVLFPLSPLALAATPSALPPNAEPNLLFCASVDGRSPEYRLELDRELRGQLRIFSPEKIREIPFDCRREVTESREDILCRNGDTYSAFIRDGKEAAVFLGRSFLRALECEWR